MTRLAERAEPRPPPWKTLLGVGMVFVLLYLFLGGMTLMGDGVKSLAKNPQFDARQPRAPGNQPYRQLVYDVFAYADNPLVGLFVGLLATSIFQSSSFTTSFTVGLVATTPLTLHQAIFIIMGANIGTSVTNAGVSFTQIRRREEFGRAYGAAIVHDFFNVLTVAVVMPIEWTLWRTTGAGFLERGARLLASMFYRAAPSDEPPSNILSDLVKPLAEAAAWVCHTGLGLSPLVTGIVLSVAGVVLLFVALILLTLTLREVVLKRFERFFDRVLFRSAPVSFLVGLILTSVVQSSSVTTSLLVPLTGAGLLTIYQIFPYTLGANIGTTVTAIMASLATGADTPLQAQVGVALAFSHLLFNITGSLVWYPLRRVPITMALWFAGVVAQQKWWAIIHLIGFFFVLPAVILLIEWATR